MWLEMWASREIFFQGDKVVEAYNSIYNQSKDHVDDARQEVNLVRGIHKGYRLFIYKSRYMKQSLTLYTPSNYIN